MKNWTFIEGLQFEDNNYGSGYPAGMFTVTCFQAGPTFLICSYFSVLFLEIALLSLLFTAVLAAVLISL